MVKGHLQVDTPIEPSNLSEKEKDEVRGQRHCRRLDESQKTLGKNTRFEILTDECKLFPGSRLKS